jgi:hypothetical protein
MQVLQTAKRGRAQPPLHAFLWLWQRGILLALQGGWCGGGQNPRGSVSWACTLCAPVSLPRMAPVLWKAQSSATITAVPTAAYSPTRGRCATRSCSEPCRRSQRSWAGRVSPSRSSMRWHALDAHSFVLGRHKGSLPNRSTSCSYPSNRALYA